MTLEQEAGRFLWDLRTPMRDGVELSSDVYLPVTGLAGGPYPVVLLRTPDNNQQAGPVALARHLADHGYAVALQDVRGRHDSGGRFTPFQDEGRDGYDSVEWFAAQPWCDGNVAMMGSGYAAWAQWAAAAEKPPHLLALASTSPMSGPYRKGMLRLPMLAWLHKVGGRVWQEGSQVDWTSVLWSLPLRAMDHAVGRDLPVWQAWLDEPALDPCPAERVDVPVLHVTGWYDDEQASALRLHAPSSQTSLLVGPWADAAAPQPSCGGVDFGSDAVVDLAAVHQAWFDRWLKDGGADQPPVRCFVTGTGEWRDLEAWPPATVPTAYSLSGEGRLSREAAEAEGRDTFAYDPADPVVMTNDFLFFPTPPARRVEPPLDRRFVERRDDVVVYTSEELLDDLEIAGAPSVTLSVSSDRTSTDWVVHLTDVSTTGSSVLVADGVQRVALAAGQVTEVAVELTSAAHVFRRGHRIRLSVTSSCFPTYARNLGTGDDAGATEGLVTRNTVHHHGSALVLPEVPRA